MLYKAWWRNGAFAPLASASRRWRILVAQIAFLSFRCVRWIEDERTLRFLPSKTNPRYWSWFCGDNDLPSNSSVFSQLRVSFSPLILGQVWEGSELLESQGQLSGYRRNISNTSHQNF